MINFVALSLLLTSLVTAGVLTPSQEPHTPQNDIVIVKEGHRAVIVELEEETDGSTRVSISLPPQQRHETPFLHKPISEEAAATAEKVKETGKRQGPLELVCDAFGKCTHRIASVIGKAKEKVAEKAEEVEGGAKEVVGEAFETAKEAAEKAKTMGKHVQRNVSTTIESAKEKTKEKAEQAKELAERAKEKTKEKAEQVRQMTEQVAETAKEKTKEKAEQAKEMAERAKEKTKEKAEQVREMTEQVAETAKEKTKEKAEQVKEMAERAKEKTKEKAEQGRETAEQVANRVKEGGEKVLEEILRRGQEVAAAMDWVVAVVHLLGFSTAYGICLWVTFVSGYVLAGTLPRQQFGMVQSRIYPVYFRVMAFSVGVALVGHLLGRRGKLFISKSEMLQGFHLLGSLVMILINSFYLEPQATKVMFEKMKLEKEEGRGRVEPDSVIPATPARGTTTAAAAETILTPPVSIPEKQNPDKVKSRMVKLNERLKKLNAYSSLLNIFTLVALTWHLVYLGQRLHLSC